MRFEDLDNHKKFTIKSEPNSRFHKVGHRFDGACNAYREVENNQKIPIEPASIPRGMEVKEVIL